MTGVASEREHIMANRSLQGLRKRSPRAMLAFLAAAAATFTVAAPAFADWDRGRHYGPPRGHWHNHHHRHYRPAPPPRYYAPPRAYYAPPPVYYAPPRPHYYAPAPVYAAPGLSFGINIR